jgi:uncharacterized membrane protein
MAEAIILIGTDHTSQQTHPTKVLVFRRGISLPWGLIVIVIVISIIVVIVFLVIVFVHVDVTVARTSTRRA